MTIKNYLFAFTILFVVSCGEEEKCTSEDWFGTYIGTKTCDSEILKDYSFFIHPPDFYVNDITNVILIDRTYFLHEECKIIGGSEQAKGNLNGIELNVSAETINGKCTWVATKQ